MNNEKYLKQARESLPDANQYQFETIMVGVIIDERVLMPMLKTHPDPDPTSTIKTKYFTFRKTFLFKDDSFVDQFYWVLVE